MFKRLMLGLTFLAAFSVVGVGVTGTAEAWRRWGRPCESYYYGPPSRYYHSEYAYPDYVPYRTYYRGYYRSRYPVYYGDYSHYYGYPDYYYPRRGVRISLGF